MSGDKTTSINRSVAPPAAARAGPGLAAVILCRAGQPARRPIDSARRRSEGNALRQPRHEGRSEGWQPRLGTNGRGRTRRAARRRLQDRPPAPRPLGEGGRQFHPVSFRLTGSNDGETLTKALESSSLRMASLAEGQTLVGRVSKYLATYLKASSGWERWGNWSDGTPFAIREVREGRARIEWPRGGQGWIEQEGMKLEGYAALASPKLGKPQVEAERKPADPALAGSRPAGGVRVRRRAGRRNLRAHQPAGGGRRLGVYAKSAHQFPLCRCHDLPRLRESAANCSDSDAQGPVGRGRGRARGQGIHDSRMGRNTHRRMRRPRLRCVGCAS